MMIQILSRTSLKTLDTIRCTSIQFNKLTYNSYLLHIFNQRNDIVSGLIVQKNITHSSNYIKKFLPSPESNRLDLGCLPDNARIVASSEQGIIVSETLQHLLMISYYVCKPATNQVSALPNPRTMYKTEMVSIVLTGSKPLHYKIIRLSRPKNHGLYWQSTYCCEIYDSMTRAWRLLDLLILPYSVAILTHDTPITTRGSVYVLLSNNLQVLKFDSYLEKWTTFSSPNPSRFVLDRKLVKYEGKLGLACKLYSSWEIWVLKIDESWVKTCVLKNEEDLSHETLYDSDASVMLDYNLLLLYRLREADKIDKAELDHLHFQTFIFRSDLEPIDFIKVDK